MNKSGNTPAATTKPPVGEPGRWQKFAFGVGCLNEQGAVMAFGKLTAPIYQITMGLNPALVGLALTIMRLWDAVTDPLVGLISDRTRSRWGRRRPFMMVGGLLSALSFPLVWTPTAGWSEGMLFAYFLATGLVFLTANTIYSVPYLSLGLEAAPTYHSRTRLWAWRGFAIPVLIVGIDWVYAWVQSDMFESTAQGLQVFAWGFGGLILVCSVLPALFLRERSTALAPGETTARAKPPPLIRSLRDVLAHRPYRILVGILLLSGIASAVFNYLSIYLKIYFVFGGDTKAGAILSGWVSLCYQVLHFASVPLVIWMAQRFGKKRAMTICVILGGLGAISKYFVYNPNYPYLIMAATLLLAPAAAGYNVLIASMMADVCDADELKSGLRREGLFSSVNSWLNKLVYSAAGVLSGLMLWFIGFDEARGGAQDPQTLFWMRFWFAAGPAMAAAVALGLLTRYELSESKVAEIREQLGKRSG